jgi:hypothetical protein
VKKPDQRVTILIILGVTLLAMFVLAASLKGMKLSEGQHIPLDKLFPTTLSQSSESTPDVALIEKILQIISIILWAIVPFYIIYLILSPAARKQFLKDVARLIPFMILMLILFNALDNMQKQAATPTPHGMAIPNGAVNLGTLAPSTDFKFDSNPPEWAVTMTVVIIGVIATGLLIGGFYFFYRMRREKQESAAPLRKMGEEAQSAIDLIQGGGDLRDVIIRSYLEMTRIVQENRNLHRSVSMTPSEFEAYLTGRGLPQDPVHNLTQLFEKVRYGAAKPGYQEESTAIASLTAIVNACRRPA